MKNKFIFEGAFSIGKADREKLTQSQGPGPGSYSFNEIPYKTPSYSIRAKPKIPPQKGHGPGPGHYDAELVNAAHTSVPKIIQTRSRNSQVDDYRNYSFGSFVDQKRCSFSFGYKLDPSLNPNAGGPGPGSYQQQSFLSQNKKCSFKQAPKDLSTSAEHGFPGPGDYSPNFEFVKNSSSITIGNESRKGQLEWVYPGPGEYSIPEVGPGRKSVISPLNPITQQFKQNKVSSPGPADYMLPEVKTKSMAILRPSKPAKDKVIPSQFNYQIPRFPFKESLGRGMLPAYKKRDDIVGQQDTPGPGHYQLQGLPGSIAYSMRAKLQREDREEYQASCAYYSPQFSSVSKHSPHAYMIGRKDKQQAVDMRTYTPFSQLVVKQQPGWSFNQEKREVGKVQNKLVNTELPGDAQYDTIGLLPGYIEKQVRMKQVKKKRNRKN